MPGISQEYKRSNLAYLIEKSEESRQSSLTSYTSSSIVTPSIRETLLNWLLDLAPDLRFSIEVALVAFTYIDSFLKVQSIPNLSALELLAITALSLAMKFNESTHLRPQTVSDLFEGKYSIDAISTMEVYLLKVLNWKLDVDTPCNLINHLIDCTFEANERIRAVAHSYAALCYIDSSIVSAGNYCLAIASISMALDRLGHSEFKEGWLEVVQGIKLDREKVLIVEQLFSSKYLLQNNSIGFP